MVTLRLSSRLSSMANLRLAHFGALRQDTRTPAQLQQADLWTLDARGVWDPGP